MRAFAGFRVKGCLAGPKDEYGYMSILSLLLVSFSFAQTDLQLPKIVDPANPPFPSAPNPQQQPNQTPTTPQRLPDVQLPMPQTSPDLPGFAPLTAPATNCNRSGTAAPPAYVPPLPVARHTSLWPEIWGFGGFEVTVGNRMAPTAFLTPRSSTCREKSTSGLLPDKKLYIYFDMDFWGQAAGAAVTNPAQGSFDFSKRELDMNLGLAWNYWGPWDCAYG